MIIWIAGIAAYVWCVYLVMTDTDQYGQPRERIL